MSPKAKVEKTTGEKPVVLLTHAFAELALSKLLARNTKDVDPLPGTYVIDSEFTVKLLATMKRGEDHEYTPTAEIPMIPTLALILQKSGVTREQSARLLVEAMVEAVENQASTRVAIKERVRDVDAALAQVREQITAKLPKKTRKGSLRVEGIADLTVLSSKVVEA